jgi:hypothetical protein
MKKILTILFVLIILVAGGVAGGMYWFGMNLESTYRQALNQSGSQSGLILHSTSFSKSFMASDANALAMLPGLNVTAAIHQKIYPGPLALPKLLAGQLEYNPVKFTSMGTIKLNAKKELTGPARGVIARLPAAKLDISSELLSDRTRILVTIPAYKGKFEGTPISWPQTVFIVETNDRWNPIRLVNGSFNAKLPASVVENLIRLRIHLDIEALKTRRKLSPAEIKKLSPAAVKIAVANAFPGYIERYGIGNVLQNAKKTNKPINVIYRSGQIKIGGVMLPR